MAFVLYFFAKNSHKFVLVHSACCFVLARKCAFRGGNIKQWLWLRGLAGEMSERVFAMFGVKKMVRLRFVLGAVFTVLAFYFLQRTHTILF